MAFIIFVTFIVFAGMSFSVTTTIATALVSSRLDYYNSLFNNIALNVMKLQCVQNRLARVVTRSPHFYHPEPLLPVRYRIILKICVVTYQALSSKQPAHSCKTAQIALIIYFSFPVLRKISELQLIRLLPNWCWIGRCSEQFRLQVDGQWSECPSPECTSHNTPTAMPL